MERDHLFLSLGSFTCGILSAKWAMELGHSQLRQALWGVAGLLFGPLTLLVLYVRLVGTPQARHESGGQWASGAAEVDGHRAALTEVRPTVGAL